ncbi:MAG: hypothetical protein R3Y28_03565 [Candidatus Gastranaerophilales bacterium]
MINPLPRWVINPTVLQIAMVGYDKTAIPLPRRGGNEVDGVVSIHQSIPLNATVQIPLPRRGG